MIQNNIKIYMQLTKANINLETLERGHSFTKFQKNIFMVHKLESLWGMERFTRMTNISLEADYI